MENMFTKRLRVISGALLLVLFTTALVPAFAFQTDVKRGRKYVPPPAMATIEVLVIRATSGKPIPNAAVIFHPMQDEKNVGNMELKTTEEGKAVIDVITIGDTLRLQVIANGFQTYGEDYKIDTASKQIVVKMKRPAEQYSIYKDHSKDGTQTPPADQAAPPPASPPAPQDKPAPK
jgi:hypothetical protein